MQVDEKVPEEGKLCGKTGKQPGAGRSNHKSLTSLQFAKHFKVEEQVSFLQKHNTGIAVGTPQRLIDLIENGNHNSIILLASSANWVTGSLSLASLQRLVVDASHIDSKKRGIVDMRETMMPLVKLLTKTELKDRYTATEQHVDLIFY